MVLEKVVQRALELETQMGGMSDLMTGVKLEIYLVKKSVVVKVKSTEYN